MTNTNSAPLHVVVLNKICPDLASATDDRLTVSGVHEELHTLWKESDETDEELRSLAAATGYLMDNREDYRSLLDDAEDGLPLSEGPFGPMFEMRNPESGDWTAFPDALRRTPEPMRAVWAKYAQEEALHPLLRARLADLLWVLRHDKQHQWHTKAVSAYVETVDESDVEVLEQEAAVIRAVNISRESNQAEEPAWEALRLLVERILDNEEQDAYGSVARCLDHLVAHKQPGGDLLDQAIHKYCSDPHRHSQLWQIKANAASTAADRNVCIVESIRILVEDANSSPGLRQLSLLKDAWGIANKANLHEVMADLEAQIARVDLESDMHTIETEFEIPEGAIAAEVDEMFTRNGDSLLDALLAFGRTMPMGSLEENQEELQRRMEATPLQFLIGRIETSPVEDQTAATRLPPPMYDQRARDIHVRKIEGDQIQLFVYFTGCGFLRELNDRHAPSIEELEQSFECVFITPNVAKRIALSFRHWSNGDQNSAVSVIVLTIEAIVRAFAAHIGITLTQTRHTSDGPHIGEAITLSKLLEALADHPLLAQVPDIPRYLQSVLTDRWSLNLRNLIAHSLTNLTEPQYAALFHVVCLMRGIADNLSEPTTRKVPEPVPE